MQTIRIFAASLLVAAVAAAFTTAPARAEGETKDAIADVARVSALKRKQDELRRVRQELAALEASETDLDTIVVTARKREAQLLEEIDALLNGATRSYKAERPR